MDIKYRRPGQLYTEYLNTADVWTSSTGEGQPLCHTDIKYRGRAAIVPHRHQDFSNILQISQNLHHTKILHQKVPGCAVLQLVMETYVEISGCHVYFDDSRVLITLLQQLS